MIKFLYSTDWHTKPKNPSTRVDDYPTTIETKVRHFFRTGHKLGVDAFLCGGDFFDSPYTSAEYVTHIGKVIQEEIKKKHLYGILGNHDIIGWNPKTIKRTAFGVFHEFSSFFTLIDRNPTALEFNGQQVELSGVSSYAQLDRHLLDEEGNVLEHRARDWMVTEETAAPRIHIVHGYASERAILDEIPHTVIDEFYETNAAVTLGAHEHTGTPIIKMKNGYFSNPGALGRVFASHSEMNRMPQFVLVTIHDDGTSELEYVPCDIAKPGEEVMDRSALDEKKKKEAILAEAKGSIKELLKDMNIQGVDLIKILDRYKEQTAPDVFNETKRRLNL